MPIQAVQAPSNRRAYEGPRSSDPIHERTVDMIREQNVDVVLVGGGQAGISLSYYLQQRQVRHIILERDRAFSSWRNRWDGFRANTPNWMNTLPVVETHDLAAHDPDGFATREEILDYLEKCLEAADPPIRTHTEVNRITQLETGRWEVYTDNTLYETQHVAVCIGAMSTPNLPKAAAEIPDSVPQFHSSKYQNPDQIATGSVLLVGSASSGVQICQLLGQSGRFDNIHLAVSKVMVLPKRVLGIPIHRIVHFLGLFDVRKNSVLGKVMYSNLESKGDPIMRPAPRDLADLYGVHLVGKFIKADGALLHFSDRQTLPIEGLTIVWCTGFRGDYSIIDVGDRASVFTESGYPIHVRGVVEHAPGLYFVGLRYQHTVASHDIYGVAKDAEYVADHICSRLGTPKPVKRARQPVRQ